MATQTFACPACGSHKTLDDPRPGEKLHCTCGMSFPASPVFAVATPARGNRLSGTGWAVGVGACLLVGTAAAAAWLMSRPQAGPPESSGQPSAVTQGSAPTSNPPSPPVARGPDTPDTTPSPPDQPPPTPPSNPAPPPTPPSPLPAAMTVSAVTLWDAFDLDPPRPRPGTPAKCWR